MMYANATALLAASASALKPSYVRLQESFTKRYTSGPGRGDCHRFANGTAPLPDKHSWESFVDYYDAANYTSTSATPRNYELVFQDFNTTIASPDYLGVYTIYDYDTVLCAEICDTKPGCQAFNIYVSRDPSQDPGPACPNPAATANFKCSLFAAPVNASLATNPGQIQPPADVDGHEFVVVVKASNAYNKVEPNPFTTNKVVALKGYDWPIELPAAINGSAPNTPVKLLETQVYKDVFDPSVCARLCDFITRSNLLAGEEHDADPSSKSGGYIPCNYFNVYELVDENGSKDGFYCALFTGEMPPSAATVESVTDTAGNAVNVTSSWGYRVYTPDEDVVPEYTPLETEPKANTSTAIIPVVHVYQASNTTTAVESSESPCSTSTTTETWLLQEYTATTMETVTTSQSASSTA